MLMVNSLVLAVTGFVRRTSVDPSLVSKALWSVCRRTDGRSGVSIEMIW